MQIRVLAVVAVCVLAIIPWTGLLSRADSAAVTVPTEIRDAIAREGSVRVIVQLRLSRGGHLPEGLLSSAGAANQRSDIAATQARILARLSSTSHRLLHRYGSVPLMALQIDARALAELEASSLYVQRIMEDRVNTPSLAESVPLIGGDLTWARGFDGSSTVVAVVDTGVESTHPFLAGKVVEEACYSSTVAKRSTTVCPNGSDEQIGPGAAAPCSVGQCFHGTHVAGIAAGDGAEAGVAFSGVAKGAQMMAVQVFSKFTSSKDCGIFNTPCVGAYSSDVIAGLERVYAVHATRSIASVNLSLGGGSFSAPCDDDPAKPIIDNLRAVGVATVVASGNSGSPTAVTSPACISSTISVGATTKADDVASFSNVTSFISLFAPGDQILSSVTGAAFASLSGTSMAAPHVAGAWAVLRQAAPSGSVDELLSALQSTGVPITDMRSGVAVTRPRIQLDQALAQLVPPTVTVTAVTPNHEKAGKTVAVTIDGTGFVNGATVNAGPGIVVTDVALVSSERLTATFAIAGTAPVGGRNVIVTVPGGDGGMLGNGFTVTSAATVALVYNGMLRDRVRGGDTGRLADGALDGVLTLTLSAPGGRTVTAVQLQNGIGGVWDTTSPNGNWLLGVASTLDGGLLNNATTMAVNVAVADGGSLVLFASDYGGGQAFLPGRTLTVLATLSDGTSAQATTTVSTVVAVTAVTPNTGASGTAAPVTIDGSGFVSGASVSAGAGITVGNVVFVSPTRLTATFTIEAGTTAGTRDVTVTNPGGSGGTLNGAFTVTVASPVTLTLTYNGKLRDRVGAGDTARAGDGASDGTLTLTVSAAGGRTVTALRLQNGYGAWDTISPNGNWLLGVASTLDGGLLNNTTTMAVNVAVADGGSLVLFASDYGGGQAFLPGRTLTIFATFSDATSSSRSVVVP